MNIYDGLVWKWIITWRKNPGQLMDETEPDYEQHCEC